MPEQKFHEIKRPDERYSIEFFRDQVGGWRYQSKDRVKKRLHSTPGPNRLFESYAAALVDAQAANPWIAQTLTPHSWHVELLRGHIFSFEEYSGEYGEHHHCTACWKRIAAPNSGYSDATHDGYVTRYKIPDGSGQWQWNWVCAVCFKNLSSALKWAVSGRLDSGE